jgi:hypothetical protein
VECDQRIDQYEYDLKRTTASSSNSINNEGISHEKSDYMYSIAIQVQGRIKLHIGIHKEEEVFMFLDNHWDRLYDTLL